MKRRVIRTKSELEMMLKESVKIAGEQRELPMSFADTLVMIMKKKKMTRGKLAEASMMSENTISRMRSSDSFSPTKQMVLAVCVALDLTPAEAMSLFDKAGLSLRMTNAQDVAYHYILCNCGGYSLDEINEALYENGLETIGSWKKIIICAPDSGAFYDEISRLSDVPNSKNVEIPTIKNTWERYDNCKY